MKKFVSAVFVLVTLVMALAGCGEATTPTAAPTATAVPTATATTAPPATATVVPTATAVPTVTPVPPTATPAPTATPELTSTPVPTATPLPEPTATPKPAPTSTPKPAVSNEFDPRTLALREALKEAGWELSAPKGIQTNSMAAYYDDATFAFYLKDGKVTGADVNFSLVSAATDKHYAEVIKNGTQATYIAIIPEANLNDYNALLATAAKKGKAKKIYAHHYFQISVDDGTIAFLEIKPL